MEPRLEPVRAVCELLGDPQRAYPVIHLTGTNGKTSTARMIERLLREHNLRTGRFTSPHLHTVTERISIDGHPISDAAFADTWDEVAPLLAMVDGKLAGQGEPALTYFEVLTCMAFAAFADTPVDVAVLEVGLGGTWDATNVADATVVGGAADLARPHRDDGRLGGADRRGEGRHLHRGRLRGDGRPARRGGRGAAAPRGRERLHRRRARVRSSAWCAAAWRSAGSR